jgi:hypothetical protein
MRKVKPALRPLLAVLLAVTLNGCGGGGGGVLPVGPTADDARLSALLKAMSNHGPLHGEGPDAVGAYTYTVHMDNGADIQATWFEGQDTVVLQAVDVNHRDMDVIKVPITGVDAALTAVPNWYQYPGAIE